MEQARAIERVEVQAWRDLFAGAPQPATAALGLAGRELGGAYALSAPALDTLMFNRVVGLGMAEPVTDTLLDEIVAHYAAREAPFEINLCPLADPADLPARLSSCGLAAPFHHVKWVRGIQTAPPQAWTLRLERVKPRHAHAFATIAAEGFASGLPAARDWFAGSVGRPGWTHYVTWEGDEAVGCGAMFVTDDGAWLGLDSTHEAHRHKGSQSLIISARIRDAAAAGCRWLSSDTGPNWPDVDTTAWRNLQRAGFVAAYERQCWIRA
jgi:GNAT superfamily N-acetyltransferase